ncbi:hypothetical protein CVE36_13460, partial [Pseudomonas syringae pv. actinidiae]|nr:hypothetical protein [Pseudomonas syringae pv. actinidiae]
MLTLESLEMLLSIDENDLLDDVIITLMATPQLMMFFDKYPRLKAAVMRDLPEWKENLRQRLRNTQAPPELEKEFTCYQQTQLISDHTFQSNLPDIMSTLHNVDSPFLNQAEKLVHSASHSSEPRISSSQHSLFMQRWRLSLTLQTLNLHQQI